MHKTVNAPLGASFGHAATGRASRDLAGRRFGRLTAIRDTGRRSGNNAVWLCRCDCGNSRERQATRLNRGEVFSCGPADHQGERRDRATTDPSRRAGTAVKEFTVTIQAGPDGAALTDLGLIRAAIREEALRRIEVVEGVRRERVLEGRTRRPSSTDELIDRVEGHADIYMLAEELGNVSAGGLGRWGW